MSEKFKKKKENSELQVERQVEQATAGDAVNRILTQEIFKTAQTKTKRERERSETVNDWVKKEIYFEIMQMLQVMIFFG